MRAVRRVFLSSSSGLERSLERELQSLRVPGRFETLSGGVLVTGTNESLWRATLQSRVADSAQLWLGEPFHAPDKRALDAGLRELPWEDCLWLCGRRAGEHGHASSGADGDDAAAPSGAEGPLAAAGLAGEAPLPLRVSSKRSRLYHTQLVEERVRAAVAGRRRLLLAGEVGAGDGLLAYGGAAAPSGHTAGRARSEGAAPLVYVRLRHDSCCVAIAASGLLQWRGYRTGVGEPLLREPLAAACVLASPLLRRLAAAAAVGEELVLCDPFCGSGVMLLEALGVVLGQPPGDRARRYPFVSFPCHAEQEYAAFLDGLQATPHPALSNLTLLGVDSASGEVARARRNLRRFLRQLWRPSPGEALGGGGGGACGDEHLEAVDGPGAVPPAEGGRGRPAREAEPQLPCKVELAEGGPGELGRRLAGRPTLLLTSLFRTGKAATSGGQLLGRLLRQQQADWRGVYCVAADPEDLERQTGLEWTSELRFLNRGRWAELMQWTGRPVSSRSRAPRRRTGD